jgi:oligoribonuclease NrnB/cAMP/cGMP phosphodiesterase (DHH superfamily)
MAHGSEPPDVSGKDVWMLDFSFKRPIIADMKSKAADIHIIDHHKTAEEDLKGFDFCKFDMNKSGGHLTWEHIFGKKKPHWLVDYTEDRDLWLMKLPHTEEVSAVISSYPRDFASWDKLSKRDLKEVAKEGIAILRYKRQQIDHTIKGAIEVEFDGHKVLIANCSSINLASEVASELAKDRPFGACWYVYNGKKVWSLRSMPDGVDVSEIAKAHGGGGHEHAAGFSGELPEPQRLPGQSDKFAQRLDGAVAQVRSARDY